MHALSLALARHPGLVAYSWRVAGARRQRFARIAALCAFVHRLAAAEATRPRERGASGLCDGDIAAALLAAMLRAAGERASVAYTREMAFVRVALSAADVGRLPPWARLLRSGARGLEVGLAPHGQWAPAGYLPLPVRGALQRRRPPAAVCAALAS